MFCSALVAALAAVHCVAEVSIPDPLTQLSMFFLRSCSGCGALCCRGQHSDPLTRLLFVALLQRSLHSVQRVSILILWHSCPCLFALLQRSFAVHCVAEVNTLIL
jgi:hypothetical protein